MIVDERIIELIVVLIGIFLFEGIPAAAILYLLFDSALPEDEKKEELT